MRRQGKEVALGLATKPGGTWVQTERAAHERMARLATTSPRALSVLHILIANMQRHNAIVASQATLAALAKCSVSTLKRALEVLKAGNFIEVHQIGPSGTACAYVVNDRVAWSGKRDGIRYSLFSAAVLVSDAEQPDRELIGSQRPLERIPEVFQGEQQIPHGDGLPPPSQPAFPGLEPDLPARYED